MLFESQYSKYNLDLLKKIGIVITSSNNSSEFLIHLNLPVNLE
jgi:hypothetical protein